MASPFIAWASIDASLLRTALDCIPAADLKLWFGWILQDLRTNHGGFPDLVEFVPSRRQYRLIEVKAPGDRLQDNQRRLLEFLHARRAPVAVCRVHWA